MLCAFPKLDWMQISKRCAKVPCPFIPDESAWNEKKVLLEVTTVFLATTAVQEGEGRGSQVVGACVYIFMEALSKH